MSRQMFRALAATATSAQWQCRVLVRGAQGRLRRVCLYGGAGDRGPGRLREALRLVPHARPERQHRDSSARRCGLHRHVGQPQHKGPVRLHVRRDAVRRPSLSSETYTEITAYILQSNGAVAGERALSAATIAPIGSLTAARPTRPAVATAPAAGNAATPAP